jgi:Leucine-rich repeat (LRR) protein
MPAIQILNISRNNLSNFNFEYFLSTLLPNCSQLVSLTAERNNIDTLSSILLEFNNLRELNLSDNKIKTIDFNKFKFNKLEVIFSNF